MEERQFEEAMARMVQGDQSALKEIYESYVGYIYRIIYEVLRNKENAEDVTSEFFIRLWNKAEQFRPGSGHKGYMAAMARNMAEVPAGGADGAYGGFRPDRGGLGDGAGGTWGYVGEPGPRYIKTVGAPDCQFKGIGGAYL